jgi:hypothetical protein
MVLADPSEIIAARAVSHAKNPSPNVSIIRLNATAANDSRPTVV